MRDVAIAAGVDASTVSRVLNNEAQSRVSPETRSRILETAHTLGYAPNAFARGLRTARTFTLGFAVPQLDNPTFANILIGATSAAHARGYELLISLVEESSGNTNVYERLAHTNRVDGLLVSTLEDDDTLMKELDNASVPFVLVNRRVKGVQNCVSFDNFGAAKAATEYLLSLGHRRIAHLAGQISGSNGSQRVAGYRAALKAAGVAFDPELVFEAGYSFDGSVRACMEMLTKKPRPTAVLAATVPSAASALKVLYERRIDVPEAMSVMSIHDVDIAQQLQPPLTTMSFPLRKMGEIAANGLIDLLTAKTDVVSQIIASDGLRVRGSTAPLPKA